MTEYTLGLSQVSKLIGLAPPTLNARVNTLLKNTQVLRGSLNRFLLTPEQVKIIIEDQLNQITGKIIYVGNLKGGVGKTTLAYLIVETLSMLGFKTCALDLDVQANLTRQFDNTNVFPPVFADVIDKKFTIQDIIINLHPTLDLIPSSLKNSLIQKTLSTQTPKHYLTWFNSLCLTYLREKYDAIVIDTPPNLTTLNSIFCLCLKEHDHLIIPACADEFSIVGIDMFLEDVNSIRESYSVKSNPKISIIINKFFQNQTSNIEMFTKISQSYPDFLSKLIVKDCAKVRETTTNKTRLGKVMHGKELFEIIAALLRELDIFKDNKDEEI